MSNLPTTTEQDICPVERDQEHEIAHLIARSFHPLAISQWLAPDPVRRLQMQTDQFTMLVYHAIKNGAGYMIPGGGAAAIWMLQFSAIGTPVPMRADYDDRLRELTGDDEHYQRFAALDRAMEEHRPQTMSWHLMFLAVSPELQGQGIGSALLRRHHDRMDRAGQPAYLEAADQRSAALYRKHGYRDMKEPFRAQVGSTGLRNAARVLAAGKPDEEIYAPPFYPMWRHPQPLQEQAQNTQRAVAA